MRKVNLLICLLLLSISVKSQIYSPVKWSYAAKKTGKNEATIYVKAEINDGWHLYSVNQKPGGPLKTTFTFIPSVDYVLNGKVIEPNPIMEFEKVFKIHVFYFKDSVLFQQKIKLKKPKTLIKGRIEYMACTDERCTPPLEAEFTIAVKP